MMDSVPDILQNKGVVIFVFALALFCLERMFPAARPLAAAGLISLRDKIFRVAKNVSLAGVNAAMSPLIVIPVSAAAAGWALDWRPLWWSGAQGLILDVLLLDLWIYWWHRANHEIQFLWRFHEVHHLDEFLDVTSALRFHVGEVFLSAFVRAAVILILAVPLTSVIVFETAVLLSALFHHSNLRLPPKMENWLSRIVVTPSIHWVHHHAIRKDTDSNYATVLSVWDILFGSRSATKRWAEMPIGVERMKDRSVLGLIARPFAPRKKPKD